MKKISKFLSIILTLIMVISIIPMSAITSHAYVDSGSCGDNVTWSYNTSTYTLTISGTGSMYDYDWNNRPWESYEDKIKTVIINDGVTTIGDFAFYYCTNLKSVTIPNGMSMINDSAFYACESLTSIIIPDSVTTISDYAFRYCGLMSITIPDSVTTIGWATFANCYNLKSIIVDSNNQYYSSDECGVLLNKYKTTLIQYPIGNERKDYTIPDSVTRIGDWAFGECQSLTNVIISDNVTTIGLSAFYWCDNLADVFYSGTEEQWETISIGGENYALLRSTIHYNYHMHKYNKVITYPTCTEQGYTTYTCECGDTYIDNYVDVTGHADHDGDGYCDMDNELLDATKNCSCNCHKSGISNFFFKFALFFQKIFGSNKTCSCGVAHY